jgi:purine-nucleoside phosphorylase
MNEFERVVEAVKFVSGKCPFEPVVGIVLGSGLGDFADHLSAAVCLPYAEIPHFKKTSIQGHAGRLVMGRVGDVPVAVLQGRYHYYEGHDISDVVFPVRVLCRLGIKRLVLTNAAGGISPPLAPGDLMVIRDHLNLMGVHPLRGENDERLGPRFPDMSEVYDRKAAEVFEAALGSLGLPVRSGVYAALSGPSYETPAEIRMLSVLGADAVGMSTVPEAIAARHMGVKVAGVSCITNLAAGISPTPLSHKEVTETADRVKKTFIALLETAIPRLR